MITVYLCTKNRLELAMVYPDEHIGEVPQGKKGKGIPKHVGIK